MCVICKIRNHINNNDINVSTINGIIVMIYNSQKITFGRSITWRKIEK